jgi:esterase/lipase superfamily enzyme
MNGGTDKILMVYCPREDTKMPVVDGKHYPYTDKGMVAALAAAGKKKKKKKKGK